jgi:acyl-CoA thioesterase-1
MWTGMIRISAALTFVFLAIQTALAAPVTLLALGDSLTAGLGLETPEAFPARLEAALKAKGLDVRIVNAGVSGDTAAAGLARLDWALSEDVGGLIVELGANDALRGLDPAQTEAALDAILAKAAARKLPVLVAGMQAPPNLGPDYAAAFDAIYPRLAEKHGAILYPFFLDGVAAQPSLNQADGIHPNGKGVDIIVERIMPSVEGLIRRAALN